MKYILQTSLMMLFMVPVLGQQHFVKGTVTSAEDNQPLPGINILLKGSSTGTVTDMNGKYELAVDDKNGILTFSFVGFITEEVPIKGRTKIDIKMSSDLVKLSEVVVSGYSKRREAKAAMDQSISFGYAPEEEYYQPFNTEEYATIHENAFVSPKDHPLSTFSIDVDNASYSNMRRFLNNGQRPPIDAVRIEEMVNYFNYKYQSPVGDHPFIIHPELSYAPWNSDNMLLKIGIQAKTIPVENIPPNNLVFLIDVSGSMLPANKLPLLKESLKLLVDKLRPQDRVAMVVYAGAAGVVLPSTAGNEKERILGVLAKLEAGGSTAGGQGLELAYKIAKENFINEGNNRILLATDGDFNIGPSSNAEMERLIENKREDGIYLSVLGYGMGNYKDSKMEILADKGNGNYAYIDNLREAQKVLVDEMAGTLLVVAKDVKLQLEFNPQHVKAYRLIGYENRKLNKEDFNDDRKDAGDMGAGHTVTAMYEIILNGKSDITIPTVDDLKYQEQRQRNNGGNNELLTIKSRYKLPGERESIKLEQVVLRNPVDEPSENFRWASAVAAFGMLLRESEYINEFGYDDVLSLARGAKGDDANGYRIEFINLVQSGRLISNK